MSEKKRFLDRVLRFMGIEEEVAASNEIVAEQGIPPLPQHPSAEEQANPPRRKTRLTESGGGKHNSRDRMIVLDPRRFDDVQAIADHLLDNEPVVLTMDKLDQETARRIMDFLGGTTYATGGHIQRLGEQMFLLAPGNVEVDSQALFSIRKEQKEHFS